MGIFRPARQNRLARFTNNDITGNMTPSLPRFAQGESCSEKSAENGLYDA